MVVGDEAHERAAPQGPLSSHAGLFETRIARKALRAYVSKAQKNGARLLFVSAHDDDLRSMERMSGVRIELLRLAQGNGCARECCGLGRLRSRLPHRWQEDHYCRHWYRRTRQQGASQANGQSLDSAFDKMDVPQVGTIVVHLQRGLSDYIARVGTGS